MTTLLLIAYVPRMQELAGMVRWDAAEAGKDGIGLIKSMGRGMHVRIFN